MRLKVILILVLTVCLLSCRKSEYIIENESVISDLGGGTGTVTWTKDKTYLIDGFVFVNDGQILTIEAGTIIKARTGQGSSASALIVARGGKIIAEGTSNEPIIFTVEGDDLEGSVPLDARGLWGGLIILGNAPIISPSGEGFIEGIPISEPRGIYGGSFIDDNSGIIKYVSIRHGGTNIGEGNEINGLTLGGVGKKTLIDHVEIVSNSDDGLEVFGGNVNLSNIAVAFCGDDAFDFDEGYQGKCQFLLGILDDEAGDHVAEHTGNPYPGISSLYSIPQIYNCTFIGDLERHDSHIISFERGSGGIYKNSLFLNNETGIAIEYNEGDNDSFSRIISNDLVFSNNIFYKVAEDTESELFTLASLSAIPQDINDTIALFFSGQINKIDDPGISTDNIPYDLLPVNTVYYDLAEYSESWFEAVTYKGAFGSRNWLEGWSLLWQEGVIK
jgi:hypothetical protein